MRSCEEYAEIISRLIDNEVSESEALEVQSHIENCSSCRALFMAFSSVSDYLENELEQPPEDLTENIMANIRRTKLSAVKTEKVMRKKLFTAVAAIAALAIFCYTVPFVSRTASSAKAMSAYDNGTAATGAVYEESAAAETYEMPAEEAVFESNAAFDSAAPAFSASYCAEDAASRKAELTLSGDSANEMLELIGSAQSAEGEEIPDNAELRIDFLIEESGERYTVCGSTDRVFIIDENGGTMLIPGCTVAEINEIISAN